MTGRHAEVLVVEDDLPTREMYVYLLTQAGFTTRAAHNGRQAWEMCLQSLPDAILTDLRLPGLDGFELARDLHSHFADRTPPIIAITGYVPEDDDLRLAHAKFLRLLVKPVTPALLVEALQEATVANVNKPTNPSQPGGVQAGHDPHQGNKREAGSPQMPSRRADKDHEEPNGRASSGTSTDGKGATRTTE